MAPSNEIIASVSECFTRARHSGDLFFFPSIITKREELGVEFQIRLCPALQKKPEALVMVSEPERDSPTKKDVVTEKKGKTEIDSFTPPYNPNLHIGDMLDGDGTEYVVLLNKYALIPEHFLLVTKEFQSQSSPLMPSDLVQTYQLLITAGKIGKQYLAFYNCGEYSGASQPRKHVQFVPVEDDGPPIEVLARAAKLEILDKPFSLTKLPYANHIFRLPSRLSSYTLEKLEQVLSMAFLALLDLVVSTIRHDPSYPQGKPSYNVLMTLEHIHLIPRRQEVYLIPKTEFKVSVNALGFAGMLLVKSEEELDAVKSESVENILRLVGLGSVHEIQVADTTAEPEFT